MKLHTILILTFLGVAVLAGDIGSVHADPAPRVEQAPSRVPAPLPLEPAKRLARFNQAMKAANAPALAAIPTQSAGLTPINPRLADGSEIWDAGPIKDFGGVIPGEPDGSYFFAAYTIGGYARVHLRFPTEVNKFYIVDCRVAPSPNTKIAMGHSTTSKSNPPIDNGHALYAFQASAAKTSVAVIFEPASSLPANSIMHLGQFYGCDIIKAN